MFPSRSYNRNGGNSYAANPTAPYLKSWASVLDDSEYDNSWSEYDKEEMYARREDKRQYPASPQMTGRQECTRSSPAVRHDKPTEDDDSQFEEIITPGSRRLFAQHFPPPPPRENTHRKHNPRSSATEDLGSLLYPHQERWTSTAWEERQKREAALRRIGAHIDVVEVTEHYSLIPGGRPCDLPVKALESLKWVKFNFTRELQHIRVRKIEFIWNDRLYERFQKTREEFKRQGKTTKEMLLYHGTKAGNVSRLLC